MLPVNVHTGFGSGPVIEKHSPIDGTLLARVTSASHADVERAIGAAQRAYFAWRDVPAPKRGEVVRRYGESLRAHKRDLGRLVSLDKGGLKQLVVETTAAMPSYQGRLTPEEIADLLAYLASLRGL